MKHIILNYQSRDIHFAENVAITVGSFDGIHLAHQEIITGVVEYARRNHLTSVVVTFSPHPLEVVAPQRVPELLTIDTEKFRLIERMGVDVLVVLQFCEQLARMSAVDFAKWMLLEVMSARVIFVGDDHGFGKDRSGGRDLLQELGNQHHFEVIITKPVFYEGLRVGSTLIRQLIKAGRWSLVRQMLGRNYEISGYVVSGNQRGRVLGFPTANIDVVSKKLLPRQGVYATRVWYNQQEYHGVMNVGLRPTFTNPKKCVEVHLFDFSGDLYGEMLIVEVIAFLRDEHQFQSKEELAAQIRRDIDIARNILRNNHI